MKIDKLKNLVSNLKRRIRKVLPEPRYDPKKFFKGRHEEYGFDLRAVGDRGLSVEQNDNAYREASRTFLELCKAEKVDFASANVIDIGCGTGFYTQILRDNGVTRYLGVDIIDDRFEVLRGRFPDLAFRQLDITEEPLDTPYDLIVLIDVTQHIVDDEKFSAAMQNVRSHLAEEGVFIVTSWLTEKRTKRTYYEVARPMSYYKRVFPDYHFSEIIPFRDKFIFSIRKCASQCNCDR